MITVPTSQAEFANLLHDHDERILAARRQAYDAMIGYRQAVRKRDVAKAAFNNGGTRPSQRDLINDVSRTARMVATGELPSYVEHRHRPNPCDQVYKGRGFVDPTSGRILHVTKAAPKQPPRTVPSMARR